MIFTAVVFLLLLASTADARFEFVTLDGPIVLPPHPELPGDAPIVSQPRALLFGYEFDYDDDGVADCSVEADCAETDSCCRSPLWPYAPDLSVYDYFQEHVLPELSAVLSRNLNQAQPPADESDATPLDLPPIADPSEEPAAVSLTPAADSITETAPSSSFTMGESERQIQIEQTIAPENTIEYESGHSDIPQSGDPDSVADDIGAPSCPCLEPNDESDCCDDTESEVEQFAQDSNISSEVPLPETTARIDNEDRESTIDRVVRILQSDELDGDIDEVVQPLESLDTEIPEMQQPGDPIVANGDDNGRPSGISEVAPRSPMSDEPVIARGRGQIRFKIFNNGKSRSSRSPDLQKTENLSSATIDGPSDIASNLPPLTDAPEKKAPSKSRKFMSQLKEAVLLRRKKSHH